MKGVFFVMLLASCATTKEKTAFEYCEKTCNIGSKAEVLSYSHSACICATDLGLRYNFAQCFVSNPDNEIACILQSYGLCKTVKITKSKEDFFCERIIEYVDKNRG